MNEKIQHIVEVLPIMKQLLRYEVYFTVLDKEGKLQGYSLPDGVTPQFELGEKIEDPTGASQEVMRTGKPVHNHLPKEAMGEAFEGMIVPIMDGHEVVGCIMCTYSVDREEQILQIADKFQVSVQQVNDSIRAVVDGIDNLSKVLMEMNTVTTNVESDVHTAVDVVGKISSNASRSNILALNASIEAARSGEYGRGFAVVATEMGKLANDSGSSAKEIKSTLDVITEHLNTIVSSIKDANDMAREHMENIGEIQNTLKDTIALAEKLERNVNI